MTRPKGCRPLACLLLALILLWTMVPPTQAAYGTELQIFRFLTQEMGLNNAAACGILANIEAESAFNPNCFGDNGTSYGLCQWHNARFDNLRTYCLLRGYDYKTLEGQLQFLAYELTNTFPQIYHMIKNVPNSSDGAYEAGYAWCYYYEIPATREESSVRRGRNAQFTYWLRYGNIVVGGEIPGNLYNGSLFGGSYTAPEFYWEDYQAQMEDSGALPGTTLLPPLTEYLPEDPEENTTSQPEMETVPETVPQESATTPATEPEGETKETHGGYRFHYVPHHLPPGMMQPPAPQTPTVSGWSGLFVCLGYCDRKTFRFCPRWLELQEEAPEGGDRYLWEPGMEPEETAPLLSHG